MQSGEPIIYVAGNPDNGPLESYDPESGTYVGAIPAFLAQFAADCGYDVRYYEPGAGDRRAGLAENLQVDLISGCVGEERYANTAGERLMLFTAGQDGEEEAYFLCFTETAPEDFRDALRDYAAGRSQAWWTGAVLEAAAAAPARTVPAAAVAGAAVAVAVLLAALLVLLRRLRRERRRARARSMTDPETGLGTAAALEDAYGRVMRDQSRLFYHLVYIHLDLDHVGYLGGQEQARAFLHRGAQVLQQRAGGADVAVCAEWGGLAVLHRAGSDADAEAWASAVAAEIRDADFAGGALQRADVTAGVCPLGDEHRTLDQALFHARQCALTAGREGKDCRRCGTEQCLHCQERWQLLSDFDRGLERDEFELYIQFFVDAHSYRAVGGEALSRWNHPRRGRLNPDRFIPLLEREGRIGRLDFRGLELTCAFLEKLARQGVKDFFLSCNFSRGTFAREDFAARVAAAVERRDFPRKLLILEITESADLSRQEAGQMLRSIVAVRKLGVRVIFDDFGMGFSSFHDLQEYPMDGLKLDKDLVDHMETERGRILLQGLVQTGHRLGMTVLAEGVEEDWQIEALRELGCDVLQGFRFSVPLPAAEAEKRIFEALRQPPDDGEGEQNGGA